MDSGYRVVEIRCARELGFLIFNLSRCYFGMEVEDEVVDLK